MAAAAEEANLKEIEYDDYVDPGIENQCFEYPKGYYWYLEPSSIKEIGNSLTYIELGKGENLTRDGVYTWLLGNAGNDNKLYLMECLSINEGTNKHSHITRAVTRDFNEFVLYGAGELQKQGNKLTINSISGTYMQYVEVNQQRIILEAVKKLLQNNKNSVEIDMSMKTLINDVNIPFTLERLQKMLEIGISFIVYDSRKKCMEAKNYVLKQAKAKAKYVIDLKNHNQRPKVFDKPEMPVIQIPEGQRINKLVDFSRLMNRLGLQNGGRKNKILKRKNTKKAKTRQTKQTRQTRQGARKKCKKKKTGKCKTFSKV